LFAKLASEEYQIEDSNMSEWADQCQSRESSQRRQKNYEDILRDSKGRELPDSEISDSHNAAEVDLSKNAYSPGSDRLKTEETSSGGQASDQNMMIAAATMDKSIATEARDYLTDDNVDEAPMEDEFALHIAVELAHNSDISTEMEANEDSRALEVLQCHHERNSMERTAKVSHSNEESLFVDDGEIADQGHNEGMTAGDRAQQLLELGVWRGDTNMENTHNDNNTSFHFFENDIHGGEEDEDPLEGASTVTNDSPDTDSVYESEKFDLSGEPKVNITSYLFDTVF
jgi:hypothetical protein